MTTVTDKLTEMLNDKGRLHLQFIKYLFCGGITFVVDVAVFYAMAWLVLPSLRVDDPFGIVIGWFGWGLNGVSEQVLLSNFVVNKVTAFLASNTGQKVKKTTCPSPNPTSTWTACFAPCTPSKWVAASCAKVPSWKKTHC